MTPLSKDFRTLSRGPFILTFEMNSMSVANPPK